MGYAQFKDSAVLGDVSGSRSIRTKKEDVIGGIAVSVNRTWGRWRAELEYSWRVRTDLNAYIHYEDFVSRVESNLESQAASVNFYRYFDPIRGFQPYITAGAGVVRHTSDADYTSTRDGHLKQELTSTEIRHTWNAGVGIVFDAGKDWNIDLGYRYVALGEAATATFADGISVATGPYSSHDLALTIRKFY